MKMYNGLIEINAEKLVAYVGESKWEITSLEDISQYMLEVMAYIPRMSIKDKRAISLPLRAALKENKANE